MAQAAVREIAEKETKRKRAADITAALSPDQLRQAVELELARRSIIKEFVGSQLEPGKDFGTIPVRNRDGSVTQSKPVLFKSGMEKIFSLFNVVSTLEKDEETIEMVGKPGVIAYKCRLTRNGQFIGEGRGACTIEEKGRINDAIKIAEKRARMDACLSLGFSEYFTQDLEDMDLTDASPRSAPATRQQPAGPRQEGWRHGEVRDIEFAVRDKELRQAQSGTTYALLSTDQGTIKAWKNTQERFRIGAHYKAAVEATNWNGSISLSVVRVYHELTPEGETAEATPS